eukprot:jgi/Ulvmu1/8321/UM042_0027.1
MRLRPVDTTHTRMGAYDNILQGRSNFLEELLDASWLPRLPGPWSSWTSSGEAPRHAMVWPSLQQHWSIMVTRCCALFFTRYLETQRVGASGVRTAPARRSDCNVQFYTGCCGPGSARTPMGRDQRQAKGRQAHQALDRPALAVGTSSVDAAAPAVVAAALVCGGGDCCGCGLAGSFCTAEEEDGHGIGGCDCVRMFGLSSHDAIGDGHGSLCINSSLCGCHVHSWASFSPGRAHEERRWGEWPLVGAAGCLVGVKARPERCVAG